MLYATAGRFSILISLWLRGIIFLFNSRVNGRLDVCSGRAAGESGSRSTQGDGAETGLTRRTVQEGEGGGRPGLRETETGQ